MGAASSATGRPEKFSAALPGGLHAESRKTDARATAMRPNNIVSQATPEPSQGDARLPPTANRTSRQAAANPAACRGKNNLVGDYDNEVDIISAQMRYAF